MKHVALTVLKRMRWLWIVYNIHFIPSYLYVVFAMHRGWAGNTLYTPLVAGITISYLLFEAIAQFTLLRKMPWLTYVASFFYAVTIAIVAIEYSGVYLSPYIISILIFTFIAEAYSQYLGFVIVFLFLMGFLLGLAGVFTVRDGGNLVGLGFMVVDALTAIAGYYFWRKRYSAESTADVEKLSRSLQSTQTQSSILLQSIADGVVIIDENQTIRLFNPSAANISGWKREDAEGLDWRSVFKFVDNQGETLADDLSPIGRALQSTESVHDKNANFTSKSSKSIAVDFSVSPLLDPYKKVTGLVGIFRDVSQERQEESQRAEFISTASHEMRTPVAAIEGYLSLALNEKVATIDSRAREYLEKAHASTKHLGELFQDLLTSAKADDGRLTNHPEVVEMGAFMEQLTSDLHFSAQKKNLGIDFLIGNDSVIDASTTVRLTNERVIRPLYYTQVDPDRLREVITNLFDNACKYTDQGKVSLGLTGNDGVVQIYVRDTGHGIPPEDIPHLFQKFYRVDNSATRTIGGTGLGLFICRKIIELYRGRIWVESTLGQGSTFYINLPRLTTVQAEAMLAAQATAAVQDAGALTPAAVQKPVATSAVPTTPPPAPPPVSPSSTTPPSTPVPTTGAA